jgi:hypothetical protein
LVDEQLADALLARAQERGAELLVPDGLLSQVTKAVLEWALGAELTEHLGYSGLRRSGRPRHLAEHLRVGFGRLLTVAAPLMASHVSAPSESRAGGRLSVRE